MWSAILKPSIPHEYIIERAYWCLGIILTTMVSEIFWEMSAESSPSTAARCSSSWKQYSMLHTIPFSSLSPVWIVQDYVHPFLKCTHTHTHTHTRAHTPTMGGTVLIAFCTALKGWPPGSCLPSIGFIMVAVHPSSCCLIPETYFCFSSLLCARSFAPATLNLSPCVRLSCHQRLWCYFTSTLRPASCLYAWGRELHHNCSGPLSSPKIYSLVYRWSILFAPI